MKNYSSNVRKRNIEPCIRKMFNFDCLTVDIFILGPGVCLAFLGGAEGILYFSYLCDQYIYAPPLYFVFNYFI